MRWNDKLSIMILQGINTHLELGSFLVVLVMGLRFEN
jgi:hypothetical protein